MENLIPATASSSLPGLPFLHLPAHPPVALSPAGTLPNPFNDTLSRSGSHTDPKKQREQELRKLPASSLGIGLVKS